MSLTVKTDDITSGRRDVTGGTRANGLINQEKNAVTYLQVVGD